MEITPEIQAAIDAAVAAATKKLHDKNAELRDEHRALKAAKDDAEQAAETAAEEAARKANDLEGLEKSLERKYAKTIADLTADRDSSHKQLETLLIDNGIRDALVANNVAPHMHKYVASAWKPDAVIKDGQAFIGDQPLAEFVKAFATGDEGKQFVSAPLNSGGGATGSTTTTNGLGYTKENFNSKLGEWMMLAKSDPSSAKAIAMTVGRSDLASDL